MSNVSTSKCDFIILFFALNLQIYLFNFEKKKYLITVGKPKSRERVRLFRMLKTDDTIF